jgi:hypothetical protein
VMNSFICISYLCVAVIVIMVFMMLVVTFMLMGMYHFVMRIVNLDAVFLMLVFFSMLFSEAKGVFKSLEKVIGHVERFIDPSENFYCVFKFVVVFHNYPLK